MSPEEKDVQKRMAEKRSFRADMNRRQRLARRAMFKHRDNPYVFAAMGEVLKDGYALQRDTGLAIASGIQKYDDLVAQTTNDIARDAEAARQATAMFNQFPPITPETVTVTEPADNGEDQDQDQAAYTPQAYVPGYLERRALFDFSR